MTPEALARLLEQYRAGLEAEMAILHQLEHVAAAQGVSSGGADFAGFTSSADERDRLMQGLVAIETDLREVRKQLSEHRATASHIVGFAEVAKLHRDAAELVGRIIATDEQSIAALADAELARRSAVAGLDRGESTLAAYRRVLAPPLNSPTLVDKRG